MPNTFISLLHDVSLRRTMNREALPLIIFIALPLIVVGLITSYVLGYDYVAILATVPIIYYIVLTPFVLGVMAAAFWLRKNKD